MSIAEAEANRVADNILNEFHSEPEFLRAVLSRAAYRIASKKKKSISLEEFE